MSCVSRVWRTRRGFLHAPGRSVSPRLATLRQFFLAVACVLSATGPTAALHSCTTAISAPLAWLAAPAVLGSAVQHQRQCCLIKRVACCEDTQDKARGQGGQASFRRLVV